MGKDQRKMEICASVINHSWIILVRLVGIYAILDFRTVSIDITSKRDYRISLLKY